MKKIIISILTAIFFNNLIFSQEDGVLFRFKHKLNDSTKILSCVDEKVYLNNRFVNHAKIINRITSTVTEESEDGSGTIEANFMTTETNSSVYNQTNTWGEEFFSKFKRNPQGIYTISDEYFMPTVRDVPVFPEKKLKPGDRWTSEGTEAHDLRRSFNILKPYKVPFTARYEYLHDELSPEGKNLSVIKCTYSMYFKNPYKPQEINSETFNLPEITMGYSNQKIWWDNEKGMIDHYTEEFEITIMTFSKDNIKFSGKADAKVTSFQREGTNENLEKLNSAIENLGLLDIDVKQNEKGLTICLENIQFEADSAILLKTEKEKIFKIAELLKSFSNDLLITGHTAERGTEKSRQELSEQRASTVAEFLINLGVRKKENIFTQGKGSSEPVASNLTEDGRKKNRRVEITIMDK